MRNLGLVWRGSRRCGNGDCVEIAELESGVAIRDSTRPDGGMLRFSTADWTAFLTDLRRGRLRHP